MRFSVFLFSLLWLFVCSVGLCQPFESSVEKTEISIRRIDAVLFGEVEISRSVVSESKRVAALVKTNAPNPLVRAYLSTRPFPPVMLRKVGDGEFLLGSSGKWTVEILSQGDAGWWTDYLEVVVAGDSPPGGDPPPVDPPPGSDFSDRVRLAVVGLSFSARSKAVDIADNVALIAGEWRAGKFKRDSFRASLVSMSVQLATLNNESLGERRTDWLVVAKLIQDELTGRFENDGDDMDVIAALGELEKGLRAGIPN